MPQTKKFKKLLASVKGYYKGKKVPEKYKKKYGKIYSAEEAESIAYAIARGMGWDV